MKNRNYQYLLDIDRFAGEPDPSWYIDEGHDGGVYLGIHDTNLFDEDTARLGGHLYDHMDGNVIDNSTSDNTGPLSIVEIIEVDAPRRGNDFGEDDPESDLLWWFHIGSVRVARAIKKQKLKPIKDQFAA